jgi:glyoxylase-like metal-dependent hydrolase (beta-lactamase superfamily II)
MTSSPALVPLASGVDYLDLEFQGERGIIATVLLHGPAGVALIDPGPSTTLPALRRGLAARGFAVADLRAILLTHIHLDHAGAAGSLVRENPDLLVHVSEIGAPHLVDPSRLEASARRLYGEDFDRFWGELVPVPERNVRIAAGDTVGWDAFPTPGHASHHVAYLRDGVLLAGDTCGIRVQPERYILPPTPPPDIDVEAWHASIDEIARREPDRLALTHFGVETDVADHLARLHEELERWAGWVRDGLDQDSFVARAREAAGADADLHDQTGVLSQSWLGLRRYWDKRVS